MPKQERPRKSGLRRHSVDDALLQEVRAAVVELHRLIRGGQPNDTATVATTAPAISPTNAAAVTSQQGASSSTAATGPAARPAISPADPPSPESAWLSGILARYDQEKTAIKSLGALTMTSSSSPPSPDSVWVSDVLDCYHQHQRQPLKQTSVEQSEVSDETLETTDKDE